MKQTNIPLNSVCINTEKTKTSNRFHCLIYKNGYFCQYIIGSPNGYKTADRRVISQLPVPLDQVLPKIAALFPLN